MIFKVVLNIMNILYFIFEFKEMLVINHVLLLNLYI